MNVSPLFSETHRTMPGFEAVIPASNGEPRHLIVFTGRSNPDDDTTHLNYTVIGLAENNIGARDIVTDIAGNIVEVQQGKLTPEEADSLRIEQVHVSDFWIQHNISEVHI